MLFWPYNEYYKGRIEGYEANQRGMSGARNLIPGLLCSMFFLVAISPLVTVAEENTSCCNSKEFELYMTGDSDNGKLTPFDSKLTEEKSALVTPSLLGEEQVGSWEIEWSSSGDYPAGTWSFNIPYEVVEASGVSTNATVLVKVGGSSYQSSAQLPGVFLASNGVLQVPIEVNSGSISKGDKIEVSFSLRSVVFNSPNSDSGIIFLWGSEQNDASLTLSFPLVEVEMKEVNVRGSLIFFPVTLSSGFSDEMWTRSSGGLTVQGTELSESPIVTVFEGGAEVTFVWEVPDDFSGQVNSKFHLSPQAGLLIETDKMHNIDSGENYGDDSWYPEEEPSRKGLSKLEVVIDCEFEGSSMERETTIRFDGPMSQWTRWGLDNIGNSGLGSSSWWRNMNSYANTISDTERQNGRVDDSELKALQSHLRGSKSDLSSFLSNGLMIQPDSLFGVNPVEFGPLEVSIDFGKTRAFSSEQISITISSSYDIASKDRQTLIEDFVKPGGYDFWEVVGINLEIRTGMLSGLGGVYSDSEIIEYEHRRWVIMEVLAINSVELEADEEFRLEISADNSLIFSPLISAMISVFAICLAVGIGIAITRKRLRAPSMIMIGVMGALTFSIYWFGLPMQIVLGLVSSSVLLVFPVAMISPINESAQSERANSKAGRVKCPSCGKKNPVESSVRPLRLDCIGCGSTLRLE